MGITIVKRETGRYQGSIPNPRLQPWDCCGGNFVAGKIMLAPPQG